LYYIGDKIESTEISLPSKNIARLPVDVPFQLKLSNPRSATSTNESRARKKRKKKFFKRAARIRKTHDAKPTASFAYKTPRTFAHLLLRFSLSLSLSLSFFFSIFFFLLLFYNCRCSRRTGNFLRSVPRGKILGNFPRTEIHMQALIIFIWKRWKNHILSNHFRVQRKSILYRDWRLSVLISIFLFHFCLFIIIILFFYLLHIMKI